MQDVAELIIARLRLDDAPSKFELRATGNDYCHPEYTFHQKKFCEVLKVTAPVENGRLVFKIEYLDNHDHNYELPPARQYRKGKQELTFEKDDWEGAVGFADGFMKSGCRCESLSLYAIDSTSEIASWDLQGTSEARAVTLRGAFKALLAK